MAVPVLTPDDLDVIEARLDAATKGSWETVAISSSQDRYAVRLANKQGYAELKKADADFIVTSKEVVQALLATARKQQTLLEAVGQLSQDFVMKPVSSASSIEQPGFGRGVRAAGRELRAVLDAPEAP
jgi:hypothetical protein